MPPWIGGYLPIKQIRKARSTALEIAVLGGDAITKSSNERRPVQ
jgi:hypothetical protein